MNKTLDIFDTTITDTFCENCGCEDPTMLDTNELGELTCYNCGWQEKF